MLLFGHACMRKLTSIYMIGCFVKCQTKL